MNCDADAIGAVVVASTEDPGVSVENPDVTSVLKSGISVDSDSNVVVSGTTVVISTKLVDVSEV